MRAARGAPQAERHIRRAKRAKKVEPPAACPPEGGVLRPLAAAFIDLALALRGEAPAEQA